MTQEIIEMAQTLSDGWWLDDPKLEAFAKLVAAKATDEANARSNASWTLMCKKMVEHEREACAKVCEELERKATKQPTMVGQGCQACAVAIRARLGDQK